MAKNVMTNSRVVAQKSYGEMLLSRSEILAEAINITIFSLNTVAMFIAFSKNFSNLLLTCTRRFKNSFFYNGFTLQ